MRSVQRFLFWLLAVSIAIAPGVGATSFTTQRVGDGSDRSIFDFDPPAGPPSGWPDATPDGASWIFGALPGPGPFDLTVRYCESVSRLALRPSGSPPGPRAS